MTKGLGLPHWGVPGLGLTFQPIVKKVCCQAGKIHNPHLCPGISTWWLNERIKNKKQWVGVCWGKIVDLRSLIGVFLCLFLRYSKRKRPKGNSNRSCKKTKSCQIQNLFDSRILPQEMTRVNGKWVKWGTTKFPRCGYHQWQISTI